MIDYPVKKYSIIGCCGITCGLCPRYYTEGPSRCPGCSGPDFLKVNSSCGFITCCVKNKGLEACGECNEFPCERIDKLYVENYDSFVTHKNMIPNLKFIEEKGIEEFIKILKKRVKILEEMLNKFNDGRSKNFFCLASALISIDGLENSIKEANEKIKTMKIKNDDKKAKSKILKESLNNYAKKEKVILKLNKPPHWK
jgi:hypothetical protein